MLRLGALQLLKKFSPEALESHVLAIVQCLSDEPHLAAIDCCADDISCIRLEIAEADRQAWEIELVMGGGQVWCDLGRRGCDLGRRGCFQLLFPCLFEIHDTDFEFQMDGSRSSVCISSSRGPTKKRQAVYAL